MATPNLNVFGAPELKGHWYFCGPMCDIWIAHYGPHTIDAANLAMFRRRATACIECKIEAMPAAERRQLRAAIAEYERRAATDSQPSLPLEESAA